MFSLRNKARVAVFGLAVVLLAAGVAAALTPAGTKIGNQATATYKADGKERTSASNIVYVTVQQVAGVEVGPASAEGRDVVAGQVVQHVYTVKNTGNGPDEFGLDSVLGGDLETDVDVLWYHDVNGNGVINSGEPQVTEIALAAGEEANLIAQFTVPAGAQSDDQLELALKVESEHDKNVSSPSAKVTYTVVDADVVTAVLERSPGETDAGEEIQYTLRVTNQTTQTINTVKAAIAVPQYTAFVDGSLVVHGVAQTDPGTFPADVEITNLAAGQTAVVTYEVEIDDSAPAGYIENRLSVTTGTGTNQKSFDSNRVRTLVRFAPGVEVAGDPDPHYEIDGAEVGREYAFTYTVTNTGNGDDSFYVSTSGLPADWPVQLYKSDGRTPLSREDGKYTTGGLPAGGATAIVVNVLVPVSVEDGTGDYILTTAVTSKADSSATDEGKATFKNVKGAGVSVTVGEEPISGEPNPGETVEYEVTVKNDGPTEDTFDLDHGGFPPGTVIEFFDKDGNPITEVTVEPGEKVDVYVRITIPEAAGPGDDIEGEIVGKSQNNPGVKDETTISIGVNDYVSFTVAPDRIAAVNQGSFAVYEFTLTNAGNSEKTFDLSVDGANKLTYKVLDGDDKTIDNITVGKGASATVKVRIESDFTVNVGWTEAVQLVAETERGEGGSSESVTDAASLTTTVIGSELSMVKTSDVGEQKPGGQITYSIVVENISVGPLQNVVVYDAIPQHTVFVEQSIDVDAVVEYSADGGANWHELDAENPSVPEHVTNVRWVLDDALAVGASFTVTLTVEVK